MPDKLILAIDQGTHATRALVFDHRGRDIGQARVPVDLQRHGGNKVEQSPRQILESLQTAVDGVLGLPAVAVGRIVAAGLATQRSSVLAWDRDSGDPLSPVLSWQDRRSGAALDALAAHAARIREMTGLRLSPHYGAGKLRWLLAREPAVAKARADGSLVMGPLAGFLVQHLLVDRPALVDHANASRTLLWDLQTRDWSDELLALFEIPRTVLPECRPICAYYGSTVHAAIPLQAVNGDQTAALYAQGKPPDNTVLVNIGTGAFVLLPVQEPASCPVGLLAGISQSDAAAGSYYLEGTVNGAAAALDWAGRLLGETAWEDRLPDWLDAIRDPPLFINTVGGLGAPWWRSGVAPRFVGGTPPPAAGMAAVIESIVFLIQANVALMCRRNARIERLRVTGGLANLDGLCRKLAALSGLPVQRPPQIEATARGIAWQAAGCPDDWLPDGEGTIFDPAPDATLKARYDRFIQALNTL
jgi:glycerol kinase